MPSNTVIATYRVRRGSERAFLRLLKGHWPTLQRVGLVTPEPSRMYQGRDDAGKPFFVEIFTWKSPAAVDLAHRHPEVMAVWEPMGKLVEERGGRPAWEFPHVTPLKAPRAASRR
jgi:hypothetical protein